MELNFFALAITILILLNVHRQSNMNSVRQRLFKVLLYSNALILLFDTGMWLLDGVSGMPGRFLHSFVTTVYYCLNPIICLLWYFYVDYNIFRTMAHLKRVFITMSIPALLAFALSVISNLYGCLFYIDGDNVYHRGPYFLVIGFICFAYIAHTTALILVKRRIIKNRDYIPMLVFALPPVIGGVFQILFYGLSLIWVCTTFSILIIFINIQNNELYKDYLTNLYNRRHLDNYLYVRRQGNDNKLFAGLMIDIDSFKAINDQYGHKSGDQALKHTSEILRKSFRKNDFLARYGGDEFIVFMEIQDKSDLSEAVKRLNENVAAFNAQKIVPYELSLSVGYDYYSGNSMVEFLEHIDNLMYLEKQKHNRQLQDEN